MKNIELVSAKVSAEVFESLTETFCPCNRKRAVKYGIVY